MLRLALQKSQIASHTDPLSPAVENQLHSHVNPFHIIIITIITAAVPRIEAKR
jgi:hypothetical protein